MDNKEEYMFLIIDSISQQVDYIIKHGENENYLGMGIELYRLKEKLEKLLKKVVS